MLSEDETKFFKECYENRRIDLALKYLYEDNDLEFNKYQLKFMNCIFFKDSRRVLLNCHTRFGKSFCMGALIGLYILYNKNKSILIGAPQKRQTYLIKDAFSKFLNHSKILKEMLSTSINSKEKDFNAEVSRDRFVFKNGCEIKCLGFHGTAEGVMGSGADLLIVDELSLIEKKIMDERVFRLLGDNPKTSSFVGLFNPWNKISVAYDLWCNPNYKKFNYGYKEGLEVGRLTEEFLAERKSELSDRSFKVLYESKFPTDTDETLLDPDEILKAFKREDVETNYNELYIGVDVARFGNDESVITLVNGFREIDKIIIERSDLVQLTTKIQDIIIKNKDLFEMIYIAIDDDGVGGGVSDNLIHNPMSDNVHIVLIHNGSKPNNDDRFKNKSAELWFFMKDNIQKMSLISDNKILKELASRKYNYDVKGKIQLEQKKEMKKRGLKSPDRADSLAYAFSFHIDKGNCFYNLDDTGDYLF